MRRKVPPAANVRCARRLVTMPLIVLGAGCVRTPGTAPVPAPAGAAAAGSAIRAIESSIRGALARSDTAALVALLDPQVSFAYPRGTGRGRQAVAAALLGERLGRGQYSTLVTFEKSEPCEGGATLSGVYAITRHQAGESSGLESGGFAIRLVGTDTTARVAEVVFDWSRNAARHGVTSNCRELRTVRVESSRFRVAILPLSTSAWNANKDLESDLSARGWTRGDAGVPTTDQYGRSHTLSEGAPPIVSMVSVRLVRALSLELSTELKPRTGTLATYNPAAASLLEQRYRARPVSLTVSAQWRFLTVGAGPAFVSSQWTERYEHLLLDTTTDPPSYRNDFPAGVDSTWSRRSIGAAIHATCVLPIASRLFATTMVATRLATRAALPGVVTHEHWVANLDGSYLAAGIGYAW